jgi:hypothetical protein
MESKEKLSLEKINEVYWNVKRQHATLLSSCEEGEKWGDWNPFYDLRDSLRTDIIKGVKQTICRFLAQKYGEHCNFIVSRYAGDYQSWFDENDFDAVGFVQKLHDQVGHKVDELTIKDQIRNAKRLLYRIEYESIEEFFDRATFTGTFERESHWQSVAYEYVGYLRSMLWLSHYLSQPRIGAVAPSKFKPPLFLPSEWKLPVRLEFRTEPYWKIVCYKNGTIKIHFRTTELCRQMADSLKGNIPKLLFKEQEIDLNAIFDSKSKKGKRIIKIDESVLERMGKE